MSFFEPTASRLLENVFSVNLPKFLNDFSALAKCELAYYLMLLSFAASPRAAADIFYKW